MKKLIIIVLSFGLMSFLISSCEKSSVNPNDPETTKNYLPMSIGNYWIYQTYLIDTLGIDQPVEMLDSISITRDTIINGNKFFVFEGDTYFNHDYLRLQRDSSGYIIDESGKIYFSEDNFIDTLYYYEHVQNDNIVYMTYNIMQENEVVLTVPSGTYSTLNNLGTVYVPLADITKTFGSYYANNVGQVLSEGVFVFSNSGRFESRLVRYHVNVDN
jgi:hypothetical protein